MGWKKNNPGCNASGGCGCGDKYVLIYETDHIALGLTSTFTDLSGYYTGFGLTVHDQTTYTGTISDYGLIIWPLATTNPSWWGSISGGSWIGRIHITAEFWTDDHPIWTQWVNSYNYVNALSSLTGISLIEGLYDNGCSPKLSGTSTGDPLMSGVSALKHAGVCGVSGGTTLANTTGTASNAWNNAPYFGSLGPVAWIAHNKVGAIDFVIAGDTNHLSDTCSISSDNSQFWDNLWSVPV